jgi:outer membrane receptor protein involved in Fe transport
MYVGAYENYFSVDGRPPQNADANSPNYYAPTFFHNAKLDVEVNKKFTFYLGMDNVFDTKPPLALVGNEGGVPYDNIGRYVYGGVKVNF